MKYLKTYKLFEKLNSNFYKWFGDSKVLNADGSPKIVFHGVRAGDMEEYENPESPIEIFDGNRGVGWFAENKNYANNYSDSNTIMQVYLAIKNPYILEVAPEETMLLSEFIEKIGFDIETHYSQRDEDYREVWDWYDPSYTNFLGVLESKGYDGMRTVESGGICWLPFYQDQIKSATHNNGNYEIDNPSILK